MSKDIARTHVSSILAGKTAKRPGRCRIHGLFTDYLMPNGKWSGCPQCALDDAAGAAASERNALSAGSHERSVERLRKASLIPKRFQTKRICDFEAKTSNQNTAKTVCARYCEVFDERMSSGGGLVMYGSVGTGKSHLAYGIGNELIERGYSVMGIDVYELVDIVKESFSKNSKTTEREAIREFASLDLLIIDEIGAQLGTQYEDLLIFKIINERYKQVKPTIVISNLDRDALAQRLGERVWDRLIEGGGARICFDWESHRSKV